MTKKNKSVKLHNNKCPVGYVKRKGYTRKNTGKHITARCIRSTSPYAPTLKKPKAKSKKECPSGKIPRASYLLKTIGPLRKGELRKFGYNYKLSESIRRSALTMAIKELGALNIYRKLDAVAKLSERENPLAHMVFKTDRDWIRANYVLKAF